MVESLRDVLSKSIASTSRRDSPAAPEKRIRTVPKREYSGPELSMQNLTCHQGPTRADRTLGPHGEPLAGGQGP